MPIAALFVVPQNWKPLESIYKLWYGPIMKYYTAVKKELEIHASAWLNRHVIEPKKLDTDGHILYKFIYVEFQTGQTDLWRKKSKQRLTLVGRKGYRMGGDRGSLLKWFKYSISWLGGGLTGVHICKHALSVTLTVSVLLYVNYTATK